MKRSRTTRLLSLILALALSFFLCIPALAAGSPFSIGLKYACGGWACMVSERIFGKTGYPFREVTDTSKVRAGGLIVIFDNNGRTKHYQIASSGPSADHWGQFNCCSGNIADSNGVGHVRWYNTYSKSYLHPVDGEISDDDLDEVAGGKGDRGSTSVSCGNGAGYVEVTVDI